MSARPDLNSVRGRMLRANETRESVERPKCTQPDNPDVFSAVFFDQALTNARIETPEVAHLFGVSESVVRRMRNPNARERVSFAQMLKLPPRFHFELHKVMNRRYGFGRAALAELLEAAGSLAMFAG